MRMKKRVVVKEDGRLITYYWFGKNGSTVNADRCKIKSADKEPSVGSAS